LGDGEQPHPSNYRGCSHAREELQKRKTLRAPKPATARVFSPHFKPLECHSPRRYALTRTSSRFFVCNRTHRPASPGLQKCVPRI
jgi:hypothetical protein